MIQKNIIGVDHIALQLPSLEQGVQFFHELLGFKVKLKLEFEGHKILILNAGKIEIEMWEGKEQDDSSFRNVDYGMHHLAILVKDLDTVVAHMKQIGVDVLQDIYEPTRGIREAIVQGPAGVRLQFVEQNVPLLIWRSVKGDFKES